MKNVTFGGQICIGFAGVDEVDGRGRLQCIGTGVEVQAVHHAPLLPSKRLTRSSEVWKRTPHMWTASKSTEIPYLFVACPAPRV